MTDLTEGEREIIREQEMDARPLTSSEIGARLNWLLTPAALRQPMLAERIVRELIGPATLADDIDPDDLPF